MPEDVSTWIGRRGPSQEEVPRPVALAHDAEIWLVQVEIFRTGEAVALEYDIYEATRERHRVELARLISIGEFINFHGKYTGLPSWAKFRLADIEATLESLHVTFRCEHGPKNHRETDIMIRGMFDATK